MKKEVIDNLHKAIDLAQTPTQCYYVLEGQPCCVVAQFAVLSGLPVEAMKHWEGMASDAPRITLAFKEADVEVDILVLRDIQFTWDQGTITKGIPVKGGSYSPNVNDQFVPTETERRARMHALVPEPEKE